MREPEELMAAAIRKLAKDSAAPALPDPAVIWWRFQVLARRAVEDRALRPIAVAEKVTAIVASLSVPVATLWYWPAIRSYGELRWLAPFGLGVTVLAAMAALLIATSWDRPPESGGRP